MLSSPSLRHAASPDIAALRCADMMPMLPFQPSVPTVELAPKVHMPLVGLGTWQYNSSVAHDAVTSALRLGFPLVDTALGYGNAAGIRVALREAGKLAGDGRKTIFIATKIPGGLSYVDSTAALHKAVDDLGLAYVDLISLHYPCAWDKTGGGKAARHASWRALEDFLAIGKARSIGVSHYCKRHLQELFEAAKVKPAANQVEYHIGMGSAGPNATDDKAFCEKAGVKYLSFSTLCGPCGTRELLTGPLVTSIGRAHNKSGAQVSLRWAVQQGVPVVPKSSNPKHLAENLDLFSWELSAAEMALLSAAKTPAVSGGGDHQTSGDCALR